MSYLVEQFVFLRSIETKPYDSEICPLWMDTSSIGFGRPSGSETRGFLWLRLWTRLVEPRVSFFFLPSNFCTKSHHRRCLTWHCTLFSWRSVQTKPYHSEICSLGMDTSSITALRPVVPLASSLDEVSGTTGLFFFCFFSLKYLLHKVLSFSVCVLHNKILWFTQLRFWTLSGEPWFFFLLFFPLLSVIRGARAFIKLRS